MVQLTIDGRTIAVEAGVTVLKAAREAGIQIPTLCDHPAVKPYGSCRLCLVEIKGARTLQTSCTLPVMQGMEVLTSSPAVLTARKFVLSMLFSERNHFCPFCQVTGGDCELQNAALTEKLDHWPIQPNWNPFPVDASSPYILLDHNRCILCRRCARVCSELVGVFTLDMECRGSDTMLSADMGHPLGESSCISCGACVQVCPTGALVDRFSAYQGKRSDLTVTRSVCAGCGLGCEVDVLTRDNRLVRIEGVWENETNHGVLCQVGRWGAVADQRQRVTTPMVRINGKLVSVSLDEAVAAAIKIFKDHTGAAAMASMRLPVETLVALSGLASGGFKTSKLSGPGVKEIAPYVGLQFVEADSGQGWLVETDVHGPGGSSNYEVKAGANTRAADRLKFAAEPSAVPGAAALVLLGDDCFTPELKDRLTAFDQWVAAASFMSPELESAAVILPLATCLEQEGHYLNMAGKLQKANPALVPPTGVLDSTTCVHQIALGVGVAEAGDWRSILS